MQPPLIASCPQCGTQLAPTMLVCPNCQRLVHADTLTALAQSAKEATDRGDLQTAMGHWRDALDLLPRGSKQYQTIAAKITELGSQAPQTASQPSAAGDGKSKAIGMATGLGAVGLMLWKFKALLGGLTKGSTFFSMLLSLGVYWTAFGWQFALGLVLSIYIHEMGHVIALRRYGFKATAPMFIPGLGALIRLQQHVVNPREDAEIGLAGPIYGLGAAIAALVLWQVTGQPVLAAIAAVGAWINIFNLLPIGTLDGGRGFHAMSRPQKLLAAATVGGAWFVSNDGMLILVGLFCAGRAIGDKPNPNGNWKATITYCLLIVFLTAIAMLRLHPDIAAPI